MSRQDYLDECRAKWVAAIHEAVGATPPSTSVWRGPSAIVAALQPFARAVNHMHFPTGGGHDLAEARVGGEPGTIELRISDRMAYLAKPRALTLEYIAADPGESFITLDLDDLAASGVYEPSDGDRDEELVELSPGHYVERGVWDAGYTDHDERGYEIPLPKDARLLHRLFNGRLLFVTKGSIWNGSARTYDGRHDRLTNDQIRGMLEQAIASADEEL